MMHDTMSDMMGAMGFTYALVVVVLVLGAAVLIKISLLHKQGRSMMHRVLFAGLVAILIVPSVRAQQDSVARGQRDFRVCAPCHSLEPDHNMTGPSLAGLWGRKAGSLSNFERYSDALKSSGIIWEEHSLDEWLTDPDRMIPDNEMPFNGIKDARNRADLLAFLKEATKPGAAPQRTAQAPMGGMGGMMGGGGQVPNLKSLEPNMQVKAITYCHDTYLVITMDGNTRHFWEHNLRLKTDSSQDGPQHGAPALVPAGMMGDRADVIFAEPSEITKTIEERC